ncbi:glycosyltransferase family 4 protein [Yinghuangia soli]|uniref:Glycosyltransferase family 4 protein n=1 Tax=Yinghuangia soli TaxID=2908204 RepID=A0AA41TZY0_9ACTN|nr:glycosyltransferase family 4 protein [Yinghuangia soli]MCF2529273.1 glycosyltransferase family 4 protein [Yinghuangia soli]
MTPLRIAVVHSFYSAARPSGENEAVRDQVAALRRAGHEVELVAVHTDDEARASRLHPLRAAATVATGLGRTPLARLRSFRPDVVHVHNLFPNLTRGWVRAWPGPLVATVHNFRPICAGSTLYRAGSVCTSCLDGDRWAGLRNGCYRDSRVASAPLAWANRKGAPADPLLSRADRLVVLSELGRRMYARAGIPAERTVLIPNFADAPAAPREPARGGAWLFAGRLTAEKGILELLARWPESVPLDVVGDGELRDAARAAAPAQVRFLGALSRAELRAGLPGRRGLVFPSRCFEGAPLVYVEALAAGLPVLAFEGSSVAESVRAAGTGTVVGWDEPLLPVLDEAARRFPALVGHCRAVFAERFTEEAWVRRTEELYRALVDQPRRSPLATAAE